MSVDKRPCRACGTRSLMGDHEPHECNVCEKGPFCRSHIVYVGPGSGTNHADLVWVCYGCCADGVLNER
jgi:hypothetical protein